MGKRKYVSTTIKGTEPRVRYGITHRPDGTFIGEHAMSGMLVDAEGNDQPLVSNRLVFQCEHDNDEPWQGVVALTGPSDPSVQVRCDVCRYTQRLSGRSLCGLLALALDDDARVPGLLSIGRHDRRLGAAYVVVNLRAAQQLAALWEQRLADSRAADEAESM